jgi:hypothetical protein
MKISAIKDKLRSIEELQILQADGELVPRHFHITEVGVIDKHFIDCGGTVRKERKANFQLWEADDYDHRLHPEKLLNIIELSEKVLDMDDLEVEVEYQGDTIGKYDLSFEKDSFHLLPQTTDCLAKDKCGVPETKSKKQLAELGNQEEVAACTPGGGCC